MFEEALDARNKIILTHTFTPEIDGFENQSTLLLLIVEGTTDALKQGDAEKRSRMFAELADASVILQAHFPTAQAASSVRTMTRAPV